MEFQAVNFPVVLIEEHRRKPEYRGGTWAIVAIDPAGLRVKARRVNITVPERVLEAIDRFAEDFLSSEYDASSLFRLYGDSHEGFCSIERFRLRPGTDRICDWISETGRARLGETRPREDSWFLPAG